MSSIVYACPEQMPLATLSAWRDRELSGALAQRVQQHVQHCRACQHYLADLDAGGHAIRRDEAPQMQDAIWGDVQSRIAHNGATPRRATNPRLPLIAGGLVASALVVTIFAVVVGMLGRHPQPGTTLTFIPTTHAGTPTSGVTSTPPPTTTLKPGPNWQVAAGVPHGLRVAFAATTPLTGYACGLNSLSYQTNLLHVFVTHDGGGTWTQPAPAQIPGVDCQITINPLNSADIVLLAGTCLIGCGDNNFLHAWRTMDGGNTWHEFSLPLGAQLGYTHVGDPVFADDNLFVAAVPSGSVGGNGPDALHIFAVSRNGQPLQWLDLTGTNAGQSSYAFAIGKAYFLENANYQTNQVTFEKTTDGGQTWTASTPQGITLRSFFSNRIITAPDNSTAYITVQTALYRSNDGARTWQQVGTIPQNVGYPLAITPDGTWYGLDMDGNAWRQLPGDSSWHEIGAIDPTSGVTILTVLWNAQGHPIALWARQLGGFSSSGAFTVNIEYHVA